MAVRLRIKGRVEIDFWRYYPMQEPRKVGPDEFEFAGNQRILG